MKTRRRRELPAARPSGFWAAFFPRWYRLIRIAEPLLRRWLRGHRLGDTVVLVVDGRRSGRRRSVLLGLLSVAGVSYLGHPAGASAWTLNLDAAGVATIQATADEALAVRPVLLADGPERDDVIRATFRQHPVPGNLLYWLARRHIRAVGRFYRLEAIPG